VDGVEVVVAGAVTASAIQSSFVIERGRYGKHLRSGILSLTIAYVAVKRRKLLNRTAAAEMLGISVDTLRRWALKHEGPPQIRVGKRHYYTPEIIQQWVKSMSVAS
jgi:hypothetical protein